MAALPKQTWTPESYLAFEEKSEIRHEYYNGEIFAMAGASENHTLVVTSTSFSLYGQLRKRPCKVYTQDMRLLISTNYYTYPDVIVVCGDPLFDKTLGTSLVNPTVIIEVLSPSTEMYDRGEKFQAYRTLDSLQEYLLIAQDQVRIEHYVRQGEQWLLSDATRSDDVITLPSIDCTLALADVYEKVAFDTTEST